MPERPMYITTEEASVSIDRPVLIIDKKGYIAKTLIEKLQYECSVVVVSEAQPAAAANKALEHLLFIPFTKRVPVLPDTVYSYMFLVESEEGELDDILDSVLQKARLDQSPCVLAVPFSRTSAPRIHALHDRYSRVFLVIYGELFGGDVPYDEDIIIHRLLLQATREARVTVMNSGMRRSYPVHVEDAATGLLDVAFGTRRHKTFFLLPKHPPTELSLARMLHKANPLLSIDFVEKQLPHKQHALPDVHAEYLLDENYWLDQRLRQIHIPFIDKTQPGKQEYTDTAKKQRPSPVLRAVPKKKQHFYIARAFLLFVLTLFVLPFLVFGTTAGLGAWQLQQTKQAVQTGDLKDVASAAQRASFFLSFSERTMSVLMFEAGLIGKKEVAQRLQQKVSAAEELANTLAELSQTAISFQSMFKGEDHNPHATLLRGMQQVQEGLVVLQRQQVGDGLLTGEDNSLQQNIAAYTPLITFAGSTYPVAPAILGFEGKKTYLILFQNNMELRPTGGFIGSYGLLTVDQGRILSFTIHDVYDADGQLKGHVEPPYPVRRYLPSAHWYLRDSNFAIDFPQAASQSAQFLQIETGEKVDGVLAIDVSFVKSLVKTLGPIYISEYDETVTEENFYLLTQTHAEKDFFPGSTQKKDFLRALFLAMQQKIAAEEQLPYAALFREIGQGIAEKHVLFAFADPYVQQVFTINGFSSSLWDERQEEEGRITDFIGVNEANFGVNKTNYFIKRKIKQDMRIDGEGSVSGRVTVYYANTSESNEWPGGDYKNYLRFIFPEGTMLTGIEIDGKLQEIIPAVTDPRRYEAKDFAPPTGLEVERVDVNGKTLYGVLVSIPVGAIKTVAATYVLPDQVGTDKKTLSYDLRVFKQPGTEDDPYEFSLTYPTAFRSFQLSDGLRDTGGVVSYTGKLTTDKHFHVELAQK